MVNMNQNFINILKGLKAKMDTYQIHMAFNMRTVPVASEMLQNQEVDAQTLAASAYLMRDFILTAKEKLSTPDFIPRGGATLPFISAVGITDLEEQFTQQAAKAIVSALGDIYSEITENQKRGKPVDITEPAQIVLSLLESKLVSKYSLKECHFYLSKMSEFAEQHQITDENLHEFLNAALPIQDPTIPVKPANQSYFDAQSRINGPIAERLGHYLPWKEANALRSTSKANEARFEDDNMSRPIAKMS